MIRRSHAARSFTGAFSLIELLAVMAVVALMLSLAVPAFNSIRGSGDLVKATYDIAGILNQARAYAMANNTFVFVGIGEFDASKDSSASPQVAGTGRVALAVVAAKDGTRGYNVSNSSLPSPAWSSYSNGTNLFAVARLLRFENLHLLDFGGVPSSGNMLRQTSVAVSGSSSVTPFDWPLGKAINSGQYSFKNVLYFDPQGVARIQTASSMDRIVPCLEIGLQPAHGTAVPAAPTNQNVGNHSAIQIDGLTGATRIYRP
jgi:prepilin-type N-terminal cleavage/methylation domain-containing protein